jgi:hypothetical protein
MIGLIEDCNNSSNEWAIVETKGISGDRNIGFEDMLFISPNEGYLFGGESQAIWKGKDAYSSYTSLIYKTEDGGVNWKKFYSGNGRFDKAFWNGKDIYAVNCIEDEIRLTYSSVLYKLVGNHWKSFSKIPTYVRDIFFYDSNNGVITAQDASRSCYFLLTHDGGKTWNKQEVEYDLFHPKFIGKTAIYFTVDYETKQNLIVKHNFITGKETVNDLPKGFEVYLIDYCNKSLWILGVENKDICLYKQGDEGGFKLISKIPFDVRVFPKKLHIGSSDIFLLIGERKEGYVKNLVFRSLDNGNTWKEEKLGYPLYTNPLCFYDNPDGSFLTWIYSGTSKIQIPNNQLR